MQEKCNMAEQDLISGVNDAKVMADELFQQLIQYREACLDPEATMSVPNLDNMCDTAGKLRNMLNQIINNSE